MAESKGPPQPEKSDEAAVSKAETDAPAPKSRTKEKQAQMDKDRAARRPAGIVTQTVENLERGAANAEARAKNRDERRAKK